MNSATTRSPAPVPPITFVHVADVHIGCDRADGRLPSQDFADAFDQAVAAALDAHAAFVLVAGDFFEHSRIEPNHLAEGETGLRRLAAAGIPVVAIEGNHDLLTSYEGRPSWLTYLNRVGLVRLLRTEFRAGQPIMKEWTDADRTGNRLDLGPVRIYGAGWFGASTAKRLELLAPHLEHSGFTVLLLHAGVNHMDEEFGMIDATQLAVVRDRVDYVALGHMHNLYTVDDYAYNPGSLENWKLSDARHRDTKGFWRVEVQSLRPIDAAHASPATDGGAAAADCAAARARFTATHHPVRRRPVHVASLPCDGFRSVDEALAAVRAAARSWPLTPESAVHLRLTGCPGFDANQIDLRAVEQAVVEAGPCRAAEAVPAFGRGPGRAHTPAGDAPPRALIEDEEIDRLVADTGRYPDHVELVRGLVRSVLTLDSDEELLLHLRTAAAPLLEANDAHPQG